MAAEGGQQIKVSFIAFCQFPPLLIGVRICPYGRDVPEYP